MAGTLSALPVIPLDEAYALTAAYNADSHPEKVLLGAGVYRDENLKPWVLPSVKKVRKSEILHETVVDHEYLPIAGAPGFLKLAQQLIFGPILDDTSRSHAITSVQSISGTGANHLAALFLGHYLRPAHVFISNPTWMNHHVIWELAAPSVVRKTYPYYNPATRSMDLDAFLAELETSAVANDVVILHACAHNPTGFDPTHEQWDKIAEVIRRKGLFPIFDTAYQGFASGDLDEDAWAIRHFYKTLFEEPTTSPSPGMIVCQSFSKNFGLYGERVGALHLALPPGSSLAGAESQFARLIRGEVSTCPRFGCRVVETVLSDPALREIWQADLKTMAARIRAVRQALRSELVKLGTKGDWSHIETQIGMFSYTGLSEAQVKRLNEVHHVYMMASGRISLAGLNEKNVGYVARAIHEVVENAP
ncbi:hypothetical protein ASPZODRAFT_70084 [Penicilliopsis zonata CBS 506.65]|uniref:Aspartate aminotransferase n=1 Tax=Penicilliopsis zonata CBS 506.65 TaxID=1073090 RepID=A0A1L9SDH8_9EURO|nr:hypothetical protein ASPZODRAFT_70084 [Penicilliopsis zonata CBS 506.65]OJJ45270.1 hypothetical protein ASPZODRAFT_70084 [Penicilliopsis zonata CBS 506.65]